MSSSQLINDSVMLQIEKSDRSTVYMFGLIIIIFIAIFQRQHIGLNLVFGLTFSFFIVMYFNSRNQLDAQNLKEIYDKKTKLLRPTPKKIQKYTDYVDFFFSIQDLHPYNVPAYENLIDATDSFLSVYEESSITPALAGFNYNIADNKRKDAVNSLHSIIFHVPNSNELINKLNGSVESLNNMMQTKLDEIYSLNKLHIFNNGYNNSTVEIMRGPKAENFYEIAPYSFDLY